MRIFEIENKLKKSLPGLHSHKKMAPTGRNIIFPDDIKEYKKSAVLLALIPSKGNLYIPFIKRPQYNGKHSGQISLPGGKFEEQDVDFETTAIREANEEIGLEISKIQILGKLSSIFIPISKFIVYPYVCLYPDIENFRINEKEVEKIILVNLADLQQEKNIKTQSVELFGENHQVPFYEVENEKIWGATAMIISEFVDILK